MNRRGFIFGAGAALAVIPAARLMPVRAPKLIVRPMDLLILDDPFVVGNGLWAAKSEVEIMADISQMMGALTEARLALTETGDTIRIRSRLYLDA